VKEARFLMITMALTLFVACASWGIPGAQTFNEKLAAGYITADNVLKSTDALLLAGAISPTDAKNIVAQDDNVKAGLDIARTINATDATAGSAKLNQVITALTALQTYLATKGK
jgi:hypothetical protein